MLRVTWREETLTLSSVLKYPLCFLHRQSWPTRVDMHQDIEDSLAASSISHAGGPQSPARSAENLLNGHRSKGMLELGRREETVTDSPGPPPQVHTPGVSPPLPLYKSLSNVLPRLKANLIGLFMSSHQCFQVVHLTLNPLHVCNTWRDSFNLVYFCLLSVYKVMPSAIEACSALMKESINTLSAEKQWDIERSVCRYSVPPPNNCHILFCFVCEMYFSFIFETNILSQCHCTFSGNTAHIHQSFNTVYSRFLHFISGSLRSCLRPCSWVQFWNHQGPTAPHLSSSSQAANLSVQVRHF